jgi:alpha-D-ribose 1-methylphosphonate 5-triphosphate synthase subunit PhnG
MFHAFDKARSGRPWQRADWMAMLARAPMPMLEKEVAPAASGLRWLRRPETGLMMVQGRVGGTGERFNLGEVTVTRCALRPDLADAHTGVAWVMGRSARHCMLAALADSLLQDPAMHRALASQLLEPMRLHLVAQAVQRAKYTQATRVDFFTVARESDATTDEEVSA